MKTTILPAIVLLGLLASQAQAVIIYGPNGYGGINAYEVVTGPQQNWAGAKTASQVFFPGGGGVAGSGVIGHLGTVRDSTENTVFLRLNNGDPWIGLTDNAGDAPGAFEGGNQTGFPVPANGSTPIAGQRGYGWAWVTGEPLVFHNWNGAGEPNGGAGESHGQITGGSAAWNDLTGSSVRNYVREWDVNFATLPTPNPTPDAPGLVMTDLRNIGTVTNANYKTLAATPPAGTIASFTIVPTINFGGGGHVGGDAAFPQGGGDNFVTRFTGFIEIPTTGTYTFRMNQDDAIYFKIGNQSFEDLGCCDSTTTSMSLTAGKLPFELIFAELGGGENVEFSAAFGNFVGDPNNAAFRLVGDTANGGLAVFVALSPEPTSIAMWSLVGIGLAAFGYRRLRRAK